jgi:type II secretory pathway component PulL
VSPLFPPHSAENAQQLAAGQWLDISYCVSRERNALNTKDKEPHRLEQKFAEHDEYTEQWSMWLADSGLVLLVLMMVASTYLMLRSLVWAIRI